MSELSAAEQAGAGQPWSDHPQIAAAMAALDRLEHTPVSGHPEIFDTVHSQLRAVLTDAGRAADADQR